MNKKRTKYKSILLTGASGKLGKAIIGSGLFPSILIPSSQQLDITKSEQIEAYFRDHKIDAIIHCAAIARPSECEKNPVKAIETNIIGTSNLVMEVINQNKLIKSSIRFIHISTDGVYPSTRGNYSERDETIPYNRYGWTKLGAECAVNLLSNFCIIRTSFFEPHNIKFDYSPIDLYSSKLPVNYLSKAILTILESDFIGTINIGGERKSDYDRYKEFKASLRPCKREDIIKEINFKIYYDSSMNSDLWKNLASSDLGER